MNVLILTNHLAELAGSEIVAVEAAETFKSAGCHVDLFANYIDEPMKSCLAESGLAGRDGPPLPDPFQYDVVWSQHHVLSFLLTNIAIPETWSTYFVVCSLSPFEPLEAPGWPTEIADLILANSPETAAAMGAYGIDMDRVSMFYNAAPERFIGDVSRSGTLKRLLLVSNNLADELRVAAEHANAHGIETVHLGRQGIVERIAPRHFTEIDAVATIGKTVQYSILMGCPVYVYGPYGGPGWLTSQNLQAAEQKNFSGRCCNRKLTGRQIWDEWSRLYSDAFNAIQSIKTSRMSRFRLETLVNDILAAAGNKARSRQGEISSTCRRELRHQARDGKIAEAIRCYYQKGQNAIRISRKLESELRSQRALAGKLADDLAKREREIQELKNSWSWTITAPLRAIWMVAECLTRATGREYQRIGTQLTAPPRGPVSRRPASRAVSTQGPSFRRLFWLLRRQTPRNASSDGHGPARSAPEDQTP